MPDKRYHIHVICSPDDQVEILDGLAIFMEKRAFLTRDLMQGDNESAGYSRRCIDACDYLFMLIGDSYGKLHNTGVSQLHLSYIYAKTKAKPIVIFIKLHDEKDKLSRQYQDFTLMVEKQNSSSIYYYDETININEFFEPVYNKLITEYKKSGWQKALLEESASSYFNNLRHKKSEPAVKVRPPPIVQSVSETKLLFENDKSVNLDISVMVNFTAHAYEESNLKDVTLMASLTWRQVLTLIDEAINAIYLMGFQRSINALIEKDALILAQEQLSKNVHAVSRVQVSIQDAKWLLSEMVQFGWVKQSKSNSVEPTTPRTKLEQDLFMITTLGKQKLQTG